jgi:hypothetical protein
VWGTGGAPGSTNNIQHLLQFQGFSFLGGMLTLCDVIHLTISWIHGLYEQAHNLSIIMTS